MSAPGGDYRLRTRQNAATRASGSPPVSRSPMTATLEAPAAMTWGAVSQCDASDCDNGKGSREARRLCHVLETDGLITGVLRRGSKHRTDGDVRDRLPHRCFDLRHGVCGVADDGIRSEQTPRRRRRQILLADMGPCRARQKCHVDPVVDDDARLIRLGGPNQPLARLEERGGRQTLCAQLDQARAAVEKRLRQTRRSPSRHRLRRRRRQWRGGDGNRTVFIQPRRDFPPLVWL